MLWVLLSSVFDSVLFRSVPDTALTRMVMNLPTLLGLSALLVSLSQSAKTLADQNAKLVQAERAAAELAAELEAVLESIVEALAVTDRHGHLTRVNRAFDARLEPGWVVREVGAPRYERSAPPAFHEDGTPFVRGELPFERALAGDTVENETMMFKTRDGPPAFFLASASPIRDPLSKEITGSVTLLRDISSLKRLERLKDEFLSTVSHELRTPLAVIRGYAELSLASSTPARRKQSSVATDAGGTIGLALRRILAEVDQMSGLIEQMLQIARLDAGRVAIKAIEVDLVEVTAAELSLLSVRPEYSRVALDVAEADGPLLCSLDRTAYRQVLVNLLSNALKYSPDGSPVTVRIFPLQGQAVVSIIDRGIGIPDEDLPMIFEKFYRSQNAINSGSVGLGLGLYITGRLVDLLSGRIQVESHPGQGTTFRVAFPLRHRDS